MGRAKAAAEEEAARQAGQISPKLAALLQRAGVPAEQVRFGSCIFANRPGDGSAREQAASCQKVLGGLANICYSFATKRYRSNCINWGILPFTLDPEVPFPYGPGDCIFIPTLRGSPDRPRHGGHPRQKVLRSDGSEEALLLHVAGLTETERQIILEGCLMNHYANQA